ncbi:MAG: hypothetical protein QM703_27300 [Gemmatales bacterium]
MRDMTVWYRPLRRILAHWLARVIERLLHLQDQLRYNLIRTISSSVAETIEDQLHRPFGSPYEEDYLDYETTTVPRLAYDPENESSAPPWQTTISRAVCWLRQWLQKPWLEAIVAGGVTVVSLFLLIS